MPGLPFPRGIEHRPRLTELLRRLHFLHARAGWPSTRRIAHGKDFSHTTVHELFTGTRSVPNLRVLLETVEHLHARCPRNKFDVESTLDEFDELWVLVAQEAHDSAVGTPEVDTVLRPPDRSELSRVSLMLSNGDLATALDGWDSLRSIAERDPGLRQSVVDLTCAYLDLNATGDAATNSATLNGLAASISSVLRAGLQASGTARPPEFSLRDIVFTGADLTAAHVQNSMITRCDLSGSDFTRIRITQSNLESTDVSSSTMVGATLESCDVQDSRLGRVDLSEATLSDLDAKGADFRGATFRATRVVRLVWSDTTLWDPVVGEVMARESEETVDGNFVTRLPELRIST